MEKHGILSRYMLSKKDLAVKIYWQPSMCLHLPRPPAPAHHIHPSYLLLCVERSLIRMAPPSLCSSVSRGSASTFCRGSGIPTTSWEQGAVNSWGPTRVHTPCPSIPFHFIPLLLALLPLPAPQWLAVQSPAHLGTGGTALPPPETCTQKWSPGIEFRIRSLSPRVEVGRPQRL